MTHISNNLPLASFCFRQLDYNGREKLIILAKTVFSIDERGRLSPLPEETQINFTDQFRGDMHSSSLLYESDIAPFKPKTDIIFNAIARAPEAKPLAGWPVQFAAAGGGKALTYSFQVSGPRFFTPVKRDGKAAWELSSIKAAAEVPLIYEYAYGGTIPATEDKTEFCPFNPVGAGMLNEYLWQKGQQRPAPQIGLPAELNNMEQHKPMTVCGCGAVNKTWQPRRGLAGTFDAAWLAGRHPLMPADFSYAYWNSAPLPLQAEPYLRGDEIISARGLFHDGNIYRFALPGLRLNCRLWRDTETEILPMRLDTVYCDIAAADYARHRVVLLWRISAENPDNIREAEIFSPDAKSEKAAAAAEQRQERLQQAFEKFGLSRASAAALMARRPQAVIWGGGEKSLNCFFDEQHKARLAADDSGRIIQISPAEFKFAEQMPPGSEAESRAIIPAELDKLCTIYVRLTNEAVPVWRPVNAYWHGNDRFYILTQPIPAGEQWAFPPNKRVACEIRYFNGQYFWAALHLAPGI